MEFGDRLVKAREKKGLNQKELAQLLGITPTRLNYWEKNKREPDVFMIKKLVFPAGAGVIPGNSFIQSGFDCFPRRCGGDP